MNQKRLFSWLLCTFVLMTVFIPMVGAQDAAQGIGNTLSEMDISLVNPFTGEGMQVTVFRVLYTLGGLVLLFAGWRFFREALGIIGFIVGSSIGASLALEAGLGQLTVLVSSVLVGMVGLLLALFAFWIGIALAGGYVGWLLTQSIVGWFGIQFADPATAQAVLIVGAILGGALAIALAFELTVVLTAYFGAVMVAAGFGLVSSGTGFVWVIALFILGLAVQVMISRGSPESVFRRRRVRD